MAKIPDPSIFPITKELLERVGDSYARFYLVLPVYLERKKKTLRVILPENFEEKTPDLIEILSFISDCKVVYDTADETALRNAIEAAYAECYGRIENCDLKFEFQCPKRWAELSVTDDSEVRFCSTCSKNVHYAKDQEQLEQFASENKCIAFFDSMDLVMGIVIPKYEEKDEMSKLVDEALENLDDE